MTEMNPSWAVRRASERNRVVLMLNPGSLAGQTLEGGSAEECMQQPRALRNKPLHSGLGAMEESVEGGRWPGGTGGHRRVLG